MRKKKTSCGENGGGESLSAFSGLRRYSVLFGFRGANDMETVGYVSTSDGICVVDSIEDAALFERENYSGRSGWANPDKWAEFFNSEECLRPWIFHPIGTTRVKEEN